MVDTRVGCIWRLLSEVLRKSKKKLSLVEYSKR